MKDDDDRARWPGQPGMARFSPGDLLARFATRTGHLPRDARRDWVLIHEKADGTTTELDFTGGRLSFIHPHLGRFTYGLAADGAWDQLSYAERAGGGSVLVPFVETSGRIHVGLITERRRYQTSTGAARGVPRGFVEEGETHRAAAVREGDEEAGLGPLGDRVFPLDEDAEPMNTNSAYVETWDLLGDGRPKGTRFFACRLAARELRHTPEGALSIDATSVGINDPERIRRLQELRFETIEAATRRGDAFTRAACALLLVAWLEGRLRGGPS